MAPKPDALPKGWPTPFPYLTASQLSPSLPPAAHASLHTPQPNTHRIPKSHPQGPSKLVRISPITTPTHPASGQSGLFATSALSPGTFILPYLGVTHGSSSLSSSSSSSSSPTHETSDYDLSLDRYLGLGVDAAHSGNEARFINDYRGVAERPNAEFREVWDERVGRRGMAVFVLPETRNRKGPRFRGVAKGEELLVSYGRGFWGARREDQCGQVEGGTEVGVDGAEGGEVGVGAGGVQ